MVKIEQCPRRSSSTAILATMNALRVFELAERTDVAAGAERPLCRELCAPPVFDLLVERIASLG
jgi:hypothetical protein